MSALQLDGIGHAYLGRTILEGIDLTVTEGEIVALVGPSGCGKSTLAHIAAGLTTPRTGRVTRSYSRHAMVFQDPALLPWATAAGNIDYVLRIAGLERRARGARIVEAAAAVALETDDLGKFPVELSGGMRQRTGGAARLRVLRRALHRARRGAATPDAGPRHRHLRGGPRLGAVHYP